MTASGHRRRRAWRLASALALARCLLAAQAVAAPPAGPASLVTRACREPKRALQQLEAGADVHAAAKPNELPIVATTIDCGTRPDGTLDDDHAALLRALLARGADVTQADAHGDTAILVAARRGNAQVIEPLVRAGASPTSTNEFGETPIGLARGAAEVGHGQASPKVEEALLRTSRWLRLQRWLLAFSKAQKLATLPLSLLLIVVVWRWRARPARKPLQLVAKGDGLPRLTALACSACGAPVPIEPRDLACPHCRAPVTIPEDYQATVAARARVAEAVREAVRRWRRVLAMSTGWVTVPLKIASLAWLPIVMAGHWSPFNAVAGPRVIVPQGGAAGYCFVLSTSLVWAAALFGYSAYLSGARARLPPMPITGNVGAPAEETCRLCRAPIRFGAGELVTCCAYCGGEGYRVAVARAARIEAENAKAAAAVSIYDAMCELEARGRAAAWSFVIACSVVLALSFTIGVFIAVQSASPLVRALL